MSKRTAVFAPVRRVLCVAGLALAALPAAPAVWRPHVRLRGRVATGLAALVAAVAVATMAAPGDAHAFSWKVNCQIGVANNTGSYSGLQPVGPVLPEVTPNPIDEVEWDVLKFPPSGVPLGPNAAHPGGGVKFQTIGLPITWGCVIHPSFKRGNDIFTCNVFAPTSGRNTFQCTPAVPGVRVQITKDNADIAGIVDVGPANVQATGARASSAAGRAVPKRVRALLRRGDLPGRGWRVATRHTHLGRLGTILATNEEPASCKDDKTSEPLAKRGGASAFVRRSNLIGSEHGVYASRRKSRRRLRAALSAHSMRCLAQLLTSTQFHSHATFARYSLPGLRGVRLWRVVVRTRAGNRTRRTYLDVAGLLHGRSNALVLFAKPKKPVSRAVERSVIRTVARRLP